MSEFKKTLKEFLDAQPDGSDPKEVAERFFELFGMKESKTQAELNDKLNAVDDLIFDTIEDMIKDKK